MPSSKFQSAKSIIKNAIEDLPEILKQSEISRFLAENREQWGLPKSMSGPNFARNLVKAKFIREHAFEFPHRSERRYAKPEVPMLAVLQSLKPNSYYTHMTALQAHGIINTSNAIYLNFEQSPHVRGSLPEQSRIDIAFKNNPRKTNNVIPGPPFDIVMLNGMHTGLLGVEEKYVKEANIEPANVRVTNLERTLIDITVRPYYAGGVENVVRAFEIARDQVNVIQLSNYLSELDFVYPYHQAIGWYMENANYSEAQLETMHVRPKQRRFYLTHNMSEPVLNETWQIFVPSNWYI